MAKDTKMETIEERAKRNAVKAIEYACGRRVGEPEYITNLFIQMATEQKAIDKELIDELIGELYTSRAYHLGITGLDSKEEIVRKEKEGDCALIRGIDRTIKYVKEAIGE